MYAGSDAQMLQFPPRPLVMERRWKSNVELAPNCPRCASPNTKFCYYNNYSLSQPRYFCKACRRYWTKGGSLRNVPVGGGCRKNRRAKPFRPSQDDGLSVVTSAVGSSSCPTGYDTSALIAPLSRGCDRDGGSDIDLAAVFAKFLNPNSSRGGEGGNCNDNGSPALLGLPGNSNLDTHLEETMVKCQTPSSVSTNQESNRFVLGIPPALVAGGGGDQDRQEERIQEFLYRDPTSFGLQSIHDEISQDLLWSDDATTLPNFGWQPATAQLPELGSFPFEDQSKISANILGDNWSLFDLSAYEIFTRP